MTQPSDGGPLDALFSDPTNRRWIAWAALALLFLLVNLHRLSTAVLSEELAADFALSAAQLGALHASFFVVYAVIQIPTGVLVDRVGPRHVGAGGAILLSLGAVGFAVGEGYVPVLASRGVIGLGSGVIFVSVLRFCANWYRTDEFATMVGMTGAFAGLGAILATTPLALTIGAIGWRTTLLVLATVGFLAGIAAYVLVRNSPVDAGLEPIENVPEQPVVSIRETGAHLRTLVRDPGQWLLSLVFFATNGTLLTLIGLWGVPYLVVVYEMEVTTASTYTLLGAVGMVVGGPAIGWLSDRLGTRYLPMTVCVGLFALSHAAIAVTGRPPLYVVAGVYAITGTLATAGLLSLTVVKERYPASASGVATATVNTAGFIGAAIIPWVMGRALDAYSTDETIGGSVVYTEFGYRMAFAITALTLGVAFVCALLLWYLDDDEGMPWGR